MATPIRALEFQYPMIEFSIASNIRCLSHCSQSDCARNAVSKSGTFYHRPPPHYQKCSIKDSLYGWLILIEQFFFAQQELQSGCNSKPPMQTVQDFSVIQRLSLFADSLWIYFCRILIGNMLLKNFPLILPTDGAIKSPMLQSTSTSVPFTFTLWNDYSSFLREMEGSKSSNALFQSIGLQSSIYISTSPLWKKAYIATKTAFIYRKAD